MQVLPFNVPLDYEVWGPERARVWVPLLRSCERIRQAGLPGWGWASKAVGGKGQMGHPQALWARLLHTLRDAAGLRMPQRMPWGAALGAEPDGVCPYGMASRQWVCVSVTDGRLY
jgi:hypothetical protein